LEIIYEYSAFWAILRPGLWITAILAIVSGLVIYRKKGESSQRIVSDEHVKILQTYIEIYAERLMLWSDFDSLEENLDRKQIRKRNYNRRIRIVQQRLNSLARAVTNFRPQLRQLDSHYAAIINQVENAESDIEALRETLQGLRRQYRSGRLTRQMYADLTRDPERKIERAKRIIESAIITLRSEI
jgi:chromosome segregation ATPase